MPDAACSPHLWFLIGVSEQVLLGTLGAWLPLAYDKQGAQSQKDLIQRLFRGVRPFNRSALAPAPAQRGFPRWRFRRMDDKNLISQEERLGEWLLRLGKV